MNYGDFKTLVSDTINKGTKYDSRIPDFVRMAVRWIERNKTYGYMEGIVNLSVDASAAEPRRLDVSSQRFKAIKAARIVEATSGKIRFLKLASPRRHVAVDSGYATGYYFEGTDYLWLDNTPSEDYTIEVFASIFTDAGTWQDSDSPWLVDKGTDLLLAQTMVVAGPYVREPELAEMFRVQRQEALKVLDVADNEWHHSNQVTGGSFGIGVWQE